MIIIDDNKSSLIHSRATELISSLSDFDEDEDEEDDIDDEDEGIEPICITQASSFQQCQHETMPSFIYDCLPIAEKLTIA